jgi:hypothetical protein
VAFPVVKRSENRFVTLKATEGINCHSDHKAIQIPSPKKKVIPIRQFKVDEEYEGIQGKGSETASPLNRKTSILNFMEKRKSSSTAIENKV